MSTFLNARNLCPRLVSSGEVDHFNTEYKAEWESRDKEATLTIAYINNPANKYHGHYLRAELREKGKPNHYWRAQWKGDNFVMTPCNEEVYKTGWTALRNEEGEFFI